MNYLSSSKTCSVTYFWFSSMHLLNSSNSSILPKQGQCILNKRKRKLVIKLWMKMVFWKIVAVLTKFWEALVKNLFYPYGILCVLTKFFLLENRLCSCGILRKLSWTKFWCVYILPLLENLHYVFLYHFWFSWKMWCVLMKELQSTLVISNFHGIDEKVRQSECSRYRVHVFFLLEPNL